MLFVGLYANNLQTFFAKLLQSVSLCQAFQKAKNYENLTTENGSNQQFSLLQFWSLLNKNIKVKVKENTYILEYSFDLC